MCGVRREEYCPIGTQVDTFTDPEQGGASKRHSGVGQNTVLGGNFLGSRPWYEETSISNKNVD